MLTRLCGEQALVYGVGYARRATLLAEARSSVLYLLLLLEVHLGYFENARSLKVFL